MLVSTHPGASSHYVSCCFFSFSVSREEGVDLDAQATPCFCFTTVAFLLTGGFSNLGLLWDSFQQINTAFRSLGQGSAERERKAK